MLAMDDLDRAEFDPVAYINSRFPDEASLDSLDAHCLALGSKITALDEEISASVQQQSLEGHQQQQDIAEAQASITDLISKIQDIKLKASQSELMVQEICADIKKLDHAKSHLQASMTALKRLQMLVTAVENLEELAASFHYREAANLLDAIQQLMTHFEPHAHVPVISELRSRVEAVRSELSKQVFRAFRELGPLVDSVADISVVLSTLPVHLRALPDLCLVVDALGSSVRKQLLEEFVRLQLVPYDVLFAPGKQHCGLDETERRFAWFKRLLKSIDSKFSTVCPAHWRVPLRLCVEFMTRTRDHLVAVLTQLESKDAIDVSLLLKALQTSLRFEQEMLQNFESTLSQVESDNSNNSHNNNDKGQFTSGSLIDEEERKLLAHSRSVIGGAVSAGFDRFLGSYVALEKQNLEEMLRRLSQEEDTATSNNNSSSSNNGDGVSPTPTGSGGVFGSSISMFVFIKNSIKRCTALTTGTAFLSLSKEFKTCMQQYADLLRQRCPPLITQAPTATGYAPHPLCRVAVGQEATVCTLINTAEYCADVVPQLEQMVRGKIDAALVDKVDFSTEVDVFNDLISLALRAVIGGALDRLDPCFRAMAAKNWAFDATVGEESAHVLQMGSVLTELVPRVREQLSLTYFNSMCTRLATEVLLKFNDIILRQRLLSDAACQQLLLDTYNLKTLLLHLHSLGNATGAGGGATTTTTAAPPAIYSKFVLGRAGQIETVLKLTSLPPDLLLERFRVMWPEGRLEDLVVVMTLKGLRKQEQTALMETHAAIVATIPSQPTSTQQQQQQQQQSHSSSSSSLLGSTLFSLDAASQASVRSGSTAVASASLAVASSVRSLTQDISSSAITGLNAVGNIKWTTGTATNSNNNNNK